MSVALAADGGPLAAPSPMQPVPFKEAIVWAKGRGVVLPEVYYGELQGLARAMSFSIAGIAKLDQLQAVKDSLTEALETGETLRDWQKRVKAGAIGLDLPAHRLENIFRTNVQGNYARGRCEQQKRTAEAFPWRMYDATNDSRTRPAHAAMDGFVARHDDPVWQTWYPPCGYSCRCRVIAMTDKQAARFQAADAKRMQDPELADARATAKPDKGWDYSVCSDPTEGIRRAVEAKRPRTDHRLMGAHDAAAAAPRQLGIVRAEETQRIVDMAHIKEDQAEAVAYYVGGGHKPLNRWLRGKDVAALKSGTYDQVEASLSAAVDNLERNPYSDLTRIMGGNPAEIDEFLAAIKDAKTQKGSLYTFDTFLSTSGAGGVYDPGSVKVLIKIKAKPGSANSCHIDGLSESPEEEEVLFKPRTKFKVSKFVPGKAGKPATIELEEVE